MTLFAVTRCYRMPHGWDCYYSEFIFKDEMEAMFKCVELQNAMKDVDGLDFGFEPITKKDVKLVKQGIKIKL